MYKQSDVKGVGIDTVKSSICEVLGVEVGQGDVILSYTRQEENAFTWDGWMLPPDIFPSIRPSQSVDIQETIQKGE